MLSFTDNLKVFVALEPVDFRKGFNGLEGLVSGRLGEDLRAGALFVFTSVADRALVSPSTPPSAPLSTGATPDAY